MPALRAGHPLQNTLSRNFSNIIHRNQLLQRGVLQRLQSLEPGGQDFTRFLPHLSNPKGVNQAGKILAFGLFQGGQQIFGGFFPHTIQLCDILFLQKIQVAGGFNQLRAHKILHHGNAQTFNIHGVPAGKMGQVAQQLGGTFGAGTSDMGSILIPLHWRAANRADFWEKIGLYFPRALFQNNGQHFRNNLSSLAHQNGVTNANILFRDKILIVKGGVCDCSTRQAHRSEYRLGGEYTGPAYLNNDIHDLGGLYLRRVLISGSPAGKFGGGTQCFTL